jgi:formylglycine-generating enzyme required for sulfatase activity
MKTCPICHQSYADDVELCPRDRARLVVSGPGAIFGQRVAAPAQGTRAFTLPPAAAKPPEFQVNPEQPGMLKSFLLAGLALVLIAAGVLYFFYRGPKKGEVRVNRVDHLRYVWVPSGTFVMGCSPGDEECYEFEKPPHQIAITNGFWMGQTEVTVGAYKRFAAPPGRQMPPEPAIGGRPLNPGWGDDAMPVVDVTWDEAQAYCGWAGGRLPTEAEWEYAARAGSDTPRYDELDAIAWYADNSGREYLDSVSLWKKLDQAGYEKRLSENGNGMHEVAEKRANALGLYDMLGNVEEWVYDWWDPNFYQYSPPHDPGGAVSGTEHDLRGGSWIARRSDLRVSLRSRRPPGDRGFDVGFRCQAIDLP